MPGNKFKHFSPFNYQCYVKKSICGKICSHRKLKLKPTQNEKNNKSEIRLML